MKDSINGVVTFNAPSLHEGVTYDRIRLEFKNGKVVEASAGGNTDKLNAVLDVDDGARYVGGIRDRRQSRSSANQCATRSSTKKSAARFHMALGACYDEAPNGNASSLHWDLVQIQRSDTGGGEIHCDGRLIRKDGLFVIPGLEALNPENL